MLKPRLNTYRKNFCSINKNETQLPNSVIKLWLQHDAFLTHHKNNNRIRRQRVEKQYEIGEQRMQVYDAPWGPDLVWTRGVTDVHFLFFKNPFCSSTKIDTVGSSHCYIIKGKPLLHYIKGNVTSSTWFSVQGFVGSGDTGTWKELSCGRMAKMPLYR